MMELAPCRVVTEKHSPMFPPGAVLWSYALCQLPGIRRVVNDGVREESLPICSDHWKVLWNEAGQTLFWIDTPTAGDPVVQPDWIGPREPR